MKTYDDVMKDVYEAIKTSLGDEHLVSKLKAKGYHPEKKWANGEVGDFEQLKGNTYRIQITERDEWGEYPKAWVIDVEVQKIYEH
jgi:hypothetical protein